MKTLGAHLGYCMNVHPAKSLADVLANLDACTAPIKQRVAPDAPFGLGLWLPADAAAAVSRDPEPLRAMIERHGFYLFTLNGFPYGPFHATKVKRAVYFPDWADPLRLAFTRDLFDVMAALLPDGVEGSISTVPVTYGKDLPPAAIPLLLDAADYARAIHARTGKRIRLALEPEPDCYLETSGEAVAFFALLRAEALAAGRTAALDYLGVCFDTCHLCLQGEDLIAAYRSLLDAGIAIPKVQISAALRLDNRDGQTARTRLAAYDEPVYLHQTRVFPDTGIPATATTRFPDLGPALAANPSGVWRVHFHVPLPFAGDGPLTSTADALTPEFLRLAAAHSPNLEIETYTFHVLPDPKPGIVDSIVGEFNWLLPRFHG